jgi:MSHA biogenesis protein MshO
MTTLRAQYGKGFTLVEMVITIVLTVIVAGMVAVFMRHPMQAYVDSEARAELTDTADAALRRMARDLRLALPNSVRITPDGQYLEFLLTKTGGRYLAAEDTPSAGAILSFTASTQLSFDVVGSMPVGSQAIVPGDFIVVNNQGSGAASYDAYDCTGSCNRAEVDTTSGNTISLKTSNPFGNLTVAGSPASRRFQVVTSPVTYVCRPATGVLERYSGYTITASQPNDITNAPLTGAGVVHAWLATGVTACNFSPAAGSDADNPRNDLIGLNLTLTDNGESVSLFQQVQVDITP